MTKKTFVILTVLFATLFIGSSVFASSAVENGANDMGTEMKDSWNKLSGTVQNVGNNARGAIDNMGETAQNMMNTDNNNDNNNGNNNDGAWFGDNTDTNGYTATRTADTTTTGGTLFGMTSNTWTWFIIAVITVAIIALVWYYGTQKTDTKSTTNTRNR